MKSCFCVRIPDDGSIEMGHPSVPAGSAVRTAPPAPFQVVRTACLAWPGLALSTNNPGSAPMPFDLYTSIIFNGYRGPRKRESFQVLLASSILFPTYNSLPNWLPLRLRLRRGSTTSPGPHHRITCPGPVTPIGTNPGCRPRHELDCNIRVRIVLFANSLDPSLCHPLVPTHTLWHVVRCLVKSASTPCRLIPKISMAPEPRSARSS